MGHKSPWLRLSGFFATLLLWLGSISLAAMTAILCWQVFARYVLNSSPAWTEQSALVLMMWMVFLGSAAGILHGFHIRIAEGVERMSEKLARLARLLAHGMAMIFGLLLVAGGIELCIHTWSNQVPTLPLSKGMVYLVIPLSGALIMLFTLVHLITGDALLQKADEDSLPEGDQLMFWIFVLLLLLALLLYIGTPVGIALTLSASLVLFGLDIPLVVAVQRMASGLNIFALMAIPLFILAGELMNQAGMARRLIKLSESAMGRAPGGLGQVTILASMLFGAVSGSAVASASSLGSALGPEMRKRGYDPDYAVNVTTTASITGLLIPPSHNMIIYATVAGSGVSVGHLFLGGIVPGVVTGLVLMVVAAIIAVRRGYPAGEFPGMRVFLAHLVTSIPGILTAVIIVAGIMAGIFTPTESAAIACAYTILIGMLLYRELTPHKLWLAIMAALRTTAIVMFIIAAASLFGWVLAVLQAPERLADLLAPAMTSPTLTLLLILLMLLILGTFMDMAPLILITTPIFLPIAMSVGMDPVQFGVVLMLALGIGLVTPPIGSVLFVGCAVQNVPMGRALRTIWPFYLALFIALILVCFIPSLTLALPQALG